MEKLIMTDGAKSVNLLDTDDPSVWTFYGAGNRREFDILYSKVSAVFSVLNAKANIIGNMPFTINDFDSGEVFDDSKTWKNKVGFMHNPGELFRIDTLSYSVSNAIYNLRNRDILGYKDKRLVNAIPYSFTPVIDPSTGQLLRIERTVTGGREIYQPDDKRLFRLYRLDHTTEVLPSPNTEAEAMFNAAGILYHADMWIKHFYERGGIPPTIIAMKGVVSPDKKDKEEESWANWFRQLGRFSWRPGRIVNADALEVKQMGASVTELRDNVTYEQALRNVATVVNMPLSMILPDSTKYGVAKSEEKATWFDVYLIPFCNWLANGYNEQIFIPMGKFLQFHPETLDPQQEDETRRAQAYSTYINAKMKPSVAAQILGIELPDGIEYADLDTMQEEAQEESLERQEELFNGDKPGAKPPKDEDKQETPAKWTPSLEQMRELQRWQELAFRKFKRDEALDFEWRNDTLPENIYNTIKTNLPNAKEEMSIKQVFDVAQFETHPQPVQDEGLKALADAINRYADALTNVKQIPSST